MARDFRNRTGDPYREDGRPHWGGQGPGGDAVGIGGRQYADASAEPRAGSPSRPQEPERDQPPSTDWPDYDRTWRGDRDYGYGYHSRGTRPRRDFAESRGMWANQGDASVEGWEQHVGTRTSGRAAISHVDWRYRDDRQGQHRGRGPKGYARSDERIRDDVSEALAEDSYIDASDIDVSVNSGIVTLTGYVADRGTKRRAEICVEHVSGVQDVQNNLRIGRPEDFVARG